MSLDLVYWETLYMVALC